MSVRIQFTADGSRDTIAGMLYGSAGPGIVIIAHGGYSNLESWSAVASTLAGRGFRVLVFRSRAAAEYAGRGDSRCMYDAPCQAEDVLAAVHYLRARGVRPVHLLGGSMGGAAVAEAAIRAGVNEVGRVVVLAPARISAPERMPGGMFVATRYDSSGAGPRLPGLQAQFSRVAEPKRFMLLDGTAHAQRIFQTSDGARVIEAIVAYIGGH